MNEEHQKSVARIKSASRSKNTEYSYEGDWRRFLKFCFDWSYETNPPSPATILMYCGHLHDNGKKISTIRRAVSSISHCLESYPDNPCRSDEVRNFLRDCQRDRPSDKKRAPALRFDTLVRLVKSIKPLGMCAKRDRAMLCLLWFGALRRSELAALNCEDLEISTEGIVLTIRRSKTDQIGEGQTIAIPHSPSGSPIDPTTIIMDWCGIAKFENNRLRKRLGMSNGSYVPLFPRLWDSTRNQISFISTFSMFTITPRTVARIVDRRLSQIGETGYSAHSFRAGLITEFAASGVEDHRIAAISRHKSPDVLRSYIREGQTWKNNAISIFFEKFACIEESGVLNN